MRILLWSLCLVGFGWGGLGDLHAADGRAGTDNDHSNNCIMEKELNLTREWDKVFPQSDKVSHSKVTFHNRYGITLAADLYVPKNDEGRLPAIAVSGSFGAVKEQSSGVYAQAWAEMGVQAISYDPSVTGVSGGEERFVASRA